MTGLLWLMILANTVLMISAVRAVCNRVAADRRHPSPDQVLALRASMGFALAMLGVAVALYVTSDGRRFSIVRDWWHFCSITATFTAWLAIRILQGEPPHGRG
jgi:hypothetical protein